MSVVTNILLLLGLGEGGISSFQTRIPYPLMPIQGGAGGTKNMECRVWAAAYNYLDEDEFVEAFRGTPWEYPESVQLLIKRQEEDKFTEVSLYGNP